MAERVAAVVGEYLDAAHGGESAAPGLEQPLMDAGLDSLDLLKARCRGRHQQCGLSMHAKSAGAAGACRAGPDCVAPAGGEPAGQRVRPSPAAHARVRLPHARGPGKLPGSQPPGAAAAEGLASAPRTSRMGRGGRQYCIACACRRAAWSTRRRAGAPRCHTRSRAAARARWRMCSAGARALAPTGRPPTLASLLTCQGPGRPQRACHPSCQIPQWHARTPASVPPARARSSLTPAMLGAGRPTAAGAGGPFGTRRTSQSSSRSSGVTMDASRRSVRRTSLALAAALAGEPRPKRRSSAYVHGHLAGLLPARHAGSVLLAGDGSAVPALQVGRPPAIVPDTHVHA